MELSSGTIAGALGHVAGLLLLFARYWASIATIILQHDHIMYPRYSPYQFHGPWFCQTKSMTHVGLFK